MRPLSSFPCFKAGYHGLGGPSGCSSSLRLRWIRLRFICSCPKPSPCRACLASIGFSIKTIRLQTSSRHRLTLSSESCAQHFTTRAGYSADRDRLVWRGGPFCQRGIRETLSMCSDSSNRVQGSANSCLSSSHALLKPLDPKKCKKNNTIDFLSLR